VKTLLREKKDDGGIGDRKERKPMAGFKAPNSISSKDSNVRLGGSEPRAGKN